MHRRALGFPLHPPAATFSCSYTRALQVKDYHEGYFHALTHSKFGLVLPGHGVHSWRFLDTIRFGGIPVVVGPATLPSCDKIGKCGQVQASAGKCRQVQASAGKCRQVQV
jgi:hypothetical protein